METLIVEKKDHLCWIKINRPEAMNAINTQMARELVSVTQELALDQDSWVVAITSTNDKAFSVGADLKERRDMSHDQYLMQRALFAKITFSMKALPQPVIAGVKGYVLGGAFEIALMADVIIAGENAQIGLPEVRVGLVPGNGGTQNLPRLIGKNRAKEMIFTGKRISAQEALLLGIVSKVVPIHQVDEAVEKLANEICASAPLAVRYAKKAIEMGMDVDLHTGFKIEIETYNANLFTEDRQEGIRAFNEKRPPQWKAR